MNPFITILITIFVLISSNYADDADREKMLKDADEYLRKGQEFLNNYHGNNLKFLLDLEADLSEIELLKHDIQTTTNDRKLKKYINKLNELKKNVDEIIKENTPTTTTTPKPTTTTLTTNTTTTSPTTKTSPTTNTTTTSPTTKTPTTPSNTKNTNNTNTNNKIVQPPKKPNNIMAEI